jgi:adenylyltransferase/sulfurtransferase
MSTNTRYSRQTCLSNFGTQKQEKLAYGRVLIVGLGGLGVPVANYLNAMGIGTIGLVEHDTVELHNLQRQVLYVEDDIGKSKIATAFEKLKRQNSDTHIEVFDTFLTKENALDIIKDFDIVVDATDNFATRYLINDACVILEIPFVYGALHDFEGQVSVFNYENGPTYRCLFSKEPGRAEIPNCDENGVLGVLPGIVGTLQALEVVKVLTDVGDVLSGKLLLYNGLTQVIQKINFNLNPENKRIKKLKDSYDFAACLSVNTINAENFMQLIKTEQPQVVDVRSEKEFMAYSLPNAINIPLHSLVSSFEQIDFSAPVYLLCQSGKRSIMAYEQIKALYSDAAIFNVTGGMANLITHA